MTSREPCDDVIKQLIDKGHTLETIASEVGFSAGAVYYWGKGRLAPSIVVDKLRKMLK
jgi:hypothetical protein